MAISNYIPDNSCRYTRSKLKNVVYLLTEFHSKIIEVDGAESFVAEIGAPMRISCRNVQFNEKESLDERYKFEKELKFTVNGFADINTLSGGCYAIIMTEDGTPYMTNVDFPSKITTNYTLGTKQNSTEFTFLSKSNYPTLPVKGGIYEEVTECKTYTEYGVDSLELVEREYVAASEDSNSIVLFGGKTFHPVKFVKNSLTLTERYDGEVVTDTITFDILLDDYKSSWQYNLLEFSDNIYAALVKPKNDDNQFAVGFNLGLAPSYEINTSATEGESNRVSITLTEKSPHGMFTMQNPTISRDQGSTWRYITSVFGQDTYECVDNCVAKYLVKQEYDSKGNPMNRFKVLNGYQDRFSFLNVVGTFNERVTYYSTQCSWFSKCTLITNMPDILQFVGNSRQWRYYNFYCTCPWEIQDKPDYIEFTQTSGNGGIEISLGVRNTLLLEETTIDSFTLVYGNNYVGYEVEVNTADWKMRATYNGEEDYGVVCSENQSLTEAEVTDSGARPKTNMVQAIIGECVDSIGDYAFSGCTNLIDISMPQDSIVTIGNHTFRDCSSLNSISIPNSVESIGNNAYLGCTNAQSLYLGEDLETIGNNAFQDCTSLVEVNIPSGVTSIGLNAFEGCMRLENVTISSTDIDEIPSACFRNCVTLGSFTVPSNVANIGSYAFYGCYGLREVLFPLSLLSIGSYAFINCSGISNLVFNDGLEEIGASAFNGCTSLTNLVIPSSVTEIGANAFNGCTRLRGITVEATTPPTIDSGIFENTNNCPIYVPCSSWALYQANEDWYQLADRMQPIESDCPMKCNLRTDIRGFLIPCGESSSLTKEELDNTTIRSTAKRVIIYDCCTNISWQAFSGCTMLESVTIPDTVTSIGDYAFQECYNLSNLTIGSGVTSIGYQTFAGCSNLDNITLPQSLRTIGNFAFTDCTSLKHINIPCNTGSFGFQSCTSLSSVTLGSNVRAIDDNSFNTCTSLSSITIPSGVTVIYSGAFSNCTSLTSITIPNNVIEVNAGAFSNCTSLSSATIGSGVTSLPALLFSNCYGLSSVTMYSGVTSIGRYAFENCTTLETLNLPSKLRTINSSAFIGCSNLLTATIPSGVTTIGDNAFKGCGHLEYIRMTSITPPTLGSGAFDDTISCPIYVPCQALSTYLTASGWSDYADRIFGEEQGEITCMKKVKIGFTDETDFNWYCDDIAYVDSGQTADLCKRKRKTLNDIQTVEIGECVTQIGDKAFSGCTMLESVTLPQSLRSIGNDAFQNCRSLSSVTIPSDVRDIGQYAFYHCLALESANIPDSVSTISMHTFRGCSSLSSVTVGSGVTRIEACAFSGCTSLSSITIPSGVTYIGQEAFAYCESLTSITLPSVITSLGNKPFYECRGLQSLTIEALTPPYGVNEYTFNNAVGTYYYIYVPCDALNDYYDAWPWYRSRLRPIDSCGFKYAVRKQSGYFSRYCDTSETISFAETHNYIAPSDTVSLEIRDCAKTIDKDYVFSSTDESQRYKNMTSVTMSSDSVQQMLNPSYAFMGCTSLERVQLSNALSNVGSYAFSGCSNLSSVTSGNNITSIDEGAFYDCYNLLSFITPSGLTTIGDNAFNGCYGFTTFTMPNTVTSIGDDAFGRCFNLRNVTLSDNLTHLGERAFERCRELRSISIPSGVTSIGDATLSGCYQLSSVTLSNNITTIGVEAFRDCSRLTAITIPNSVTEIGAHAFDGSMRLRNVTMPENITSLNEGCFARCSSLKTINIPSGVTSFGNAAFSGCSNLPSIDIPSGVTEIGNRCFERCYSLSSATIPNAVTRIGNYAFSGCVALTGITMESERAPELGEGAFDNTSNCPIFVPCLSGYLNHPSWLEYRIRLVVYGEGCTPALVATYTDTSQYRVYCTDLEDDELTKDIVRAHTTSYTEMLTASVGGCIATINGAFEGCTKLTTVTLSDNITSI